MYVCIRIYIFDIYAIRRGQVLRNVQNGQKSPVTRQKRPMHMIKEVRNPCGMCVTVKRALLTCQKRRLYMIKEAPMYDQRGPKSLRNVRISQKSPMYVAKEAV